MTHTNPSLWKWTRAEDTETLASAAREVEPPLLFTLRDIRSEGTEAPLGPPWGAWALRVGEALGLGASAPPVALAVAAMTHEAGQGTPDLLVRWGWAAPLLARASDARASSLHAWLWSLAAQTQRESAEAWKLRLVLGAPALVSGRDVTPWMSLAAASAPLVALLASFERLWLDPAARDIQSAASSEWVTSAVATLPEAVLWAFAGDRSSAPRLAEVRAALERPEVDRAVTERWSAALLAARATLSPETAAPGGAFLDALEASFSYARTYLWARSFTAPTGPAHSWSLEQLPLDLARTLERVERDPAWTSSIDAQRWGVMPLEADLVADWFPRGLIELALDEAVGGRTARIRELLLEIPPGELRYYRGFRGIPPDADSLGLMLLLASRLPDPPLERLESWLALLPHNLDPDGVPHVWLRRSAQGPTHEPADLEWAGDRCTACLLSLLLGLVSWPPEHPLRRSHQGIIDALLRSVLSRFGDEPSGCHHYIPEYATYLLFRVVECLDDGPWRALRDRLARRISASQRLDGSWGSPQRTAWMLEALCLCRPERGMLQRAARYLSETQRGDGSWLPEVVYFTAGKPWVMVEYRGLEVTTAMCARALAIARRALG